MEKGSLSAKLVDLHALIDSLKTENCMLVDKVKSLKDELVFSKSQLPTSSS